MSEWSFNKLENFFTLKRGYDLPKQNRVLGNIPVISSSGQNDFHIEAKINESGVITGRYGTIGSVYFSEIPFWPLNTTLYVNDFKGNDKKFIYYFLQTLDWEKFSDKSAVPGVNRNDVHQEMVSFPSSQEQQAIASVLSALDDKIDLLQRQNQTLEQMAATLFRQWFIEEAKEDWEEVTIGDIFTLKGGSTPSTKESSFWDGNISWTSPRDLSNSKSIFMFDTERKITEAGLAKISSGLLPLRTLLMSSRAPIGYLAMTDIEVAINQGYIAIPEHQTYSTEFMYLWCQLNMDTIENAGNGSVFQEISKSSFRDLIFVIPDENTLNRFDAVVKPTFAKIKSNTQQIRTLQSLRDTLLPKLISGEVRLKGFETLLQA